MLTPHPGEAARLLGTTAELVQRDRLGAAAALQERYGGTVVLKGAGSIVQTPRRGAWLCDRGNPGMAVAGMGDVLTGAIAGIAAQCGDLPLAACAGVFAHATAGDAAAAAAGERGMLAIGRDRAPARQRQRAMTACVAADADATRACGARLAQALLARTGWIANSRHPRRAISAPARRRSSPDCLRRWGTKVRSAARRTR